VAGWIPGAQTVAGLTNAGIDIQRGNYTSAVINVASSIPLAGYLVKAGKIIITGASLLAVVKGVKNVVKNTKLIQWSSKSLEKVAKQLENGAESITVNSKIEAEELFLNIYQGKGLKNTTDFTTRDMKDKFMFPSGKRGTYYWDEFDTQHGGVPHLQIHDLDGSIKRIFY
jgi:hypothetical protein